MPDLLQISNDWGVVRVTIGSGLTATPESKLCQECTMFQSTGTGATVKATGETETLPLSASLLESFSLKIKDLAQLTFNGAQGDVITIVWRGMLRW